MSKITWNQNMGSGASVLFKAQVYKDLDFKRESFCADWKCKENWYLGVHKSGLSIHTRGGEMLELKL